MGTNSRDSSSDFRADTSADTSFGAIAAPAGKCPRAPASPTATLIDYSDLAHAARRLDGLAGRWDASAVVAAWTEPGDRFARVIGTRAAQVIGVDRAVALAARGLVAHERPAVRWRMLDPRDNLLRHEELLDMDAGVDRVLAARVEGDRATAVDFVTPRGGRGRLLAVGADVDLAEIQVEAMVLALHLPEVLAREREHEAQLRSVLSGIRAGALVVGGDNDLRCANAAAQRALDLREAIWVMPLEAVATGQLVELVSAARAAAGHVNGEIEGPRGPLAVDVCALGPQQSGALLLQLHDLAERKRVERQQNEFVGTIGHELKTPLTSAGTALELVLAGETGELNEQQQQLLALVQRNLTRLDHLVHQLLDTARQRVGRLVLRRETVALPSVLEAILEGAHRAAQRSGRNFSAGIDPHAVAHVDAVRFGEIVENLVGNALKFTPSGGNVAIRVRSGMACPFPGLAEIATALQVPTSGCEVEICDDGPGMDATTRQHAFEAFYQDGDPLADRPSGAGLGLAIVRSLVEAHDGHLELDSELARGTCVRVWIPGSAALARTVAGLRRLRQSCRDLLRRQPEADLELAPLSSAALSDLAGLDHVGGNDLLLVRIGEAHIARLSGGSGHGAPLPGARRARLGKDAPRIGTTLAHLARQLPPVPAPGGGESVLQEELRT